MGLTIAGVPIKKNGVAAALAALASQAGHEGREGP
jgi:hypothetical protein